MKGLLS